MRPITERSLKAAGDQMEHKLLKGILKAVGEIEHKLLKGNKHYRHMHRLSKNSMSHRKENVIKYVVRHPERNIY